MLNTIYETGYDLHVANYVAYLHTDKKLYEDEQVVAFYDINPQAKVHFLVVPKKHIVSAAALTEEDGASLPVALVAAGVVVTDGTTPTTCTMAADEA